MPPETIVAQVRAVAEDIGVDAVKIGMLGTAATVEAVVEALELLVGDAPVVIDPVMVAESGAVLLDAEAPTALVERLLPLATVVTPNIPEARELTGLGERRLQEELARGRATRSGRRRSSSPAATASEATDLFFDGERLAEIPGERHPDGAAHGSGCTHSSALAALPGPRAGAAGGGAAGARDRLGGGRRRPARDRRRPRPGRRSGNPKATLAPAAHPTFAPLRWGQGRMRRRGDA